MNELVIAITGAISIGFSAFFGWFFGRRKITAEAQTIEAGANAIIIDNEIKVSEYYKNMIDDLNPRYEKRFKEYEATVLAKEQLLKEEITLLRRENKILKRQLLEKDREIKERDKRIAELQKTK